MELKENQEARVREIKRLVASYYGLTVKELDSRCRKPRYAHPRMLAMYIARRETIASLVDIGKIFAGRHHSAVVHAVKRVTETIKASPATNDQIHSILQGESPHQTKLKL